MEAEAGVLGRGSGVHWEGRELRSHLPFARGLGRDLTGGALDPLPRVLAVHPFCALWATPPGCGGESEGSRATRLGGLRIRRLVTLTLPVEE